MKQLIRLVWIAAFVVMVTSASAQRYDITDVAGTKGSTSATLNNPYGSAIDSRGYIWVANSGGQTISYWDGSKMNWYFGAVNQRADVDGAGKASRFNGPAGLAIMKDGSKEYLIIGDSENGKVKKADISNLQATNNVNTIASGFKSIGGVAVSGSDIYVTDWKDFTVKKIDGSNNVSVFAGQSGVSGDKNGPVASATLYSPRGVYVDGSDVYIADAFYIRKVSGGQVSDVTPDDDLGSNFLFNASNITKGGNNWYITDECTIRKWNKGASTFTTIAGGTASQDCGYKGGKDTLARFEKVYSVSYSDKDKVLYAVDFGNHLIRQVKSAVVDNVNTANELSKVVLYPNPTSGNIFVTGVEALVGETVSVSILSTTGQVLSRTTQPVSGNQMSVPLDEVTSGVYMVQIQHNAEVVTKRLYVK